MLDKILKCYIVPPICVLALSLSGSTFATIAPPLDLKCDVMPADEVCVGQPVSLTNKTIDGVDGTLVSFCIARVVKGDLSAGRSIELWYPVGQQFLNDSVLVLLKGGPEPYRFSRTFGSMGVVASANMPYAYSADPIVNLQWELKNTLLTNADVQMDLSSTAWSKTNALLHDAIRQTAGLLSLSEIQMYVGPHLGSGDLRISACAYAAFIAKGDSAKVLPALDLIDHFPESADPAVPSLVPLELGRAISQAQLPAQMVPEIAKRLRSQSRNARELASFLLREAKLKISAPYLQGALSDSDVKVRYNAVMGLAQLFPGSKQPSFDYFATHEAGHISYWKSEPIN